MDSHDSNAGSSDRPAGVDAFGPMSDKQGPPGTKMPSEQVNHEPSEMHPVDQNNVVPANDSSEYPSLFNMPKALPAEFSAEQNTSPDVEQEYDGNTAPFDGHNFVCSTRAAHASVELDERRPHEAHTGDSTDPMDGLNSGVFEANHPLQHTDESSFDFPGRAALADMGTNTGSKVVSDSAANFIEEHIDPQEESSAGLGGQDYRDFNLDCFPLQDTHIDPRMWQDVLKFQGHRKDQNIQQNIGNRGENLSMANPPSNQIGSGTFDSEELGGFGAHNSEDEADFAAANFKELCRTYKRRVKEGLSTDADDIQFERARYQEQQRIALRAHNAEYISNGSIQGNEDGEGLFVPDENTGTFNPGLFNNDAPTLLDEDGDDTEPETFQKTKAKTPKKQGSAPKNPQKSKRGRSPKTAGVRKEPNKRKSKKQKQQMDNLANFQNLTGRSIFADAVLNQAPANQPVLAFKKKGEARKALLASIPEQDREATRRDWDQLDRASKKFTGKGVCMPNPGKTTWMLKGLQSALEHYQMLGASFMRERETMATDVNGGLVADDMGLGEFLEQAAPFTAWRNATFKRVQRLCGLCLPLNTGKTVLCIAVMVNDRMRRPSPGTPKTTLVVVPSSIVYQWMQEIKRHAAENYLAKVLQFDPKAHANDLVDHFSSQDVVVTTYSQVQKSYPKKDPPLDLMTAEEKKDWWIRHYAENKGILHSINWRRVILDEATSIKNYQSQTSLACCELKADFKWALTGTPAMNSIHEFYAYLKFLKTPQLGNYRGFKKNFTSDADGIERLIGYMRPFMLRRTHGDTIFNAKLLDLPEPHKNTMKLHFKPWERDLYKIIHDRFVHLVNGLAARGEIMKQYRNIMVLLLRLRQLVAHPLMIQDTIRDLLEPEDYDKIDKVLQQHLKTMEPHQEQANIIATMREMLRDPQNLPVVEGLADHGLSPPSSQGNSSSSQSSNRPSCTNVGRAFGLRDDFGPFLQKLKSTRNFAEFQHRTSCALCKKVPKNPHVVSCKHTYCYECLERMELEAGNAGHQRAKCVACGAFYTGKMQYKISADGGVAAVDGQSGQQDTPERPNPPRANIDTLINTWVDANGQMLPSAKTIAFKSQVMNYFEQDKQVKIIVYTHFRTLIKILKRICDIEGWAAVQIHGQKSLTARHNAIETFATDPNTRIMLATLKTGGTGLNLAMASRVILLDPWWNSAVEEQAFCRTYRRGQKSETELVRFLVDSTIDTQIEKMQQRKEMEIDSVMSTDNRVKRYDVAKLLKLFGPTGVDDRGNAFVYVDEGGAEHAPGRVVRQGEDEDIVMGDEM